MISFGTTEEHELAVHEAPLLIERFSYHLGNQLIRKSLLDSGIVVQVGRGVKEEPLDRPLNYRSYAVQGITP